MPTWRALTSPWLSLVGCSRGGVFLDFALLVRCDTNAASRICNVVTLQLADPAPRIAPESFLIAG